MSVNTRLAAQALPSPQARVAAKTPEPKESFADRMDVGFEDLLDVVNPLQQLPVVSSVYREATGENISIPARLAGGFLFGGPAGLIGSVAMVAFEEITGDSVLGHLGTLAEEIGGDAAPDTATGAATAAASLPWLKGEGDGGDSPLPSAASMVEALRRKTAVPEAVITSTLHPEENPAPQTLAKLYALQATDSGRADAVRL